MIEKYLGVKNSTRGLSDKEFEEILPILVDELRHISYINNFEENQLRKDWQNLLSAYPTSKSLPNRQNTISPHRREGLKLVEHFFPNFYDIEDWKGRSFAQFWQDEEVLQKVLRTNRQMHSTPYLSELKRTLYFVTGLPKSTMYRPMLTKVICSAFGVQDLLDPCAGWGGRMIGAVSAGSNYVGFEPNAETYGNLVKLAEFLDITDRVQLFCDVAENIPKYSHNFFDCVLTSPPYFNLEIYNAEMRKIAQNETYDAWLKRFLQPVAQNCANLLSDAGISCWNVADVQTDRKYPLISDIFTIHRNLDFNFAGEFAIRSSKRPTRNKGEFSLDRTYIFSRDPKTSDKIGNRAEEFFELK
jgi:hypothetical protein